MIRPARCQDLDEILPVYAAARAFMIQNGNPTQWPAGYIGRDLLEDDIRRGQLYVYLEEGAIHGAFVFFVGEEPCYAHIEQGAWRREGPYGVIHRVASDGKVCGVFGRCVAFCKERWGDLRIDTHADNHVMQHLIQKHGFKKCGIVHVEDGTPRIAYEYLQE